MKRQAIALLASVALWACQPHAHPPGAAAHGEAAHGEAAHDEAAHGHAHGDSAESITHYTDQTELFVEFPALVVGQESAFAAHLTRLSGFKPVDTGQVTVVLTGGGQPEERFAVLAPTVPGIFRPVAVPKYAAQRSLSVLWETDALTTVTHALGAFTVFPTADAAAHSAGRPGAEGDIAFLKEQQWPIDFAHEEALERRLRPSLAVNGTVRARADGQVQVAAPVAGRLVTPAEGWARIGQTVQRDQVLATLAPPLGAEADIASLKLAAARTKVDVRHTRQVRARLEGLLAAGAIPERRVVAARRDEAQARAEQTAAQRRLKQHRRVQHASPKDAERTGIAVRAPIAGTLVAVDATPGMFLNAGQPMFHLVDLDRLWLEARVPEANIGRVQAAAGAWFEVEGFEQIFTLSAAQVLSTGAIVDPRTRTIPVLFSVPNPQHRLRVGLFAKVHLITGAPVVATAIPTTAVLEDGGQSVAYVQTGGETFARRVLRLGIRDGAHVQVLEGIEPGDRVVTRGAFMVKLAASATAAPAHGHAH